MYRSQQSGCDLVSQMHQIANKKTISILDCFDIVEDLQTKEFTDLQWYQDNLLFTVSD